MALTIERKAARKLIRVIAVGNCRDSEYDADEKGNRSKNDSGDGHASSCLAGIAIDLGERNGPEDDADRR